MIKQTWHAIKAVFSLSGMGDGTSRNLRGLWEAVLTRWQGGAGYARLAELAMRNPHSNRAIRLISSNMADVPLIVQRRAPESGEWETPERHGYGWLLEMIDRPNARTSRMAFFQKIVTAIYCGGEFWLDTSDKPLSGPNARRPRSMRLIMPDEFEDFIRGDSDEIVGYRFRTRIRGKRYDRTVDECLHFRVPHPTDDERGQPILVGGRPLAQMEAAAAWNESIAQGGGRVPGYWRPVGLEPGKALSPDQVDAGKASLNAASREAAHDNVEQLLSGNFERVPGDVSPKDADWANAQELAIRQIATLFGIAPTLIGHVKGGSLTDAGVDSEVRAALLLTVLPTLASVLLEVSAHLLAPGYRLWYDRDQIEALNEDVNAMWERYRGAVRDNIIKRDEARVALGFDAEEDVDGEVGGTMPELALNGAQVTAAINIISEVAAGRLPRETGVQAIEAFFNVPHVLADRIMGEVGRGFVPAAQIPPMIGGDGQSGEPPALRTFKALSDMEEDEFSNLIKGLAA
jgi:HK97 family phage portal protein